MMKIKRIFLLLISVSFMLYGIWFGFNNFQYMGYFSSGGFAEILNYLFHLGAISLFFGLVWSAAKGSDENQSFSFVPRIWLTGFLSVILVAIGLVAYVNPHARFDGDRFPYVTPGARLIKINLFKELEETPDVVIFGSSRAFTIPPQSIVDKTSYSAFNMALESGGVNDYLTQLKFLLRTTSTPRVLLVEVHQNSIGDVPPNLNSQPITLLPYMTTDVAAWAAGDALKDVLSLQSISDSIFLLLNSDKIVEFWDFALTRDGLGIRPPSTREEYVNSIKETIKEGGNNSYCRNLNPRGMEVMEAFISLAEEKGIGVVLYESPINSVFYNRVYEDNPKAFLRCRNLLYGYLESLSKAHPNVFVRDLSSYNPINNLKEDGYYDAIHLRPEAAAMVVDTLLPEIESAMSWALQQAKK